MQHDANKYLVDILGAAKDIQQFVGSMTFDKYHANKLVKAAVERKFEVIGEALNRLARLSPETAAGIREYEKIIASVISLSTVTTLCRIPSYGT